MKELIKIQSELKAPKNQRNSFGNYNYRSCEDILEALKPLLLENECCLILRDEMVEIGGRVYVKATATLTKGDASIGPGSVAYAREPEDRKGMDASQITGAASSYARKYALNGLFLIDDTRDADATNEHGKGKREPSTKPPVNVEALRDEKGRKYIKGFKSPTELIAQIEEARSVSDEAAAAITEIWLEETGQ